MKSIRIGLFFLTLERTNSIICQNNYAVSNLRDRMSWHLSSSTFNCRLLRCARRVTGHRLAAPRCCFLTMDCGFREKPPHPIPRWNLLSAGRAIITNNKDCLLYAGVRFARLSRPLSHLILSRVPGVLVRYSPAIITFSWTRGLTLRELSDLPKVTQPWVTSPLEALMQNTVYTQCFSRWPSGWCQVSFCLATQHPLGL